MLLSLARLANWTSQGQIESSARWLKGYIDKKDVNSILKYIKDMEPVMSELESKFGDDAAIAKFVAEMNTLLEQARAAAGDASRGEAIQAIKSNIASTFSNLVKKLIFLRFRRSFGVVCAMVERLHGQGRHSSDPEVLRGDATVHQRARDKVWRR